MKKLLFCLLFVANLSCFDLDDNINPLDVDEADKKETNRIIAEMFDKTKIKKLENDVKDAITKFLYTYDFAYFEHSCTLEIGTKLAHINITLSDNIES